MQDIQGKISYKMYRELTDKQKAFIEYYSQTGNAKASAIKAGYSEKTAEQQGYELKNKLSHEITEHTRKLMASAAPLAIDKLIKLVEDEKTTQSVKLGAINSLLDRTGYQTVNKIEDVTNKKTDEELQHELGKLLSVIKVVPSSNDDLN